jgi:hypothetical protein|tara:strand:+ start:139 stop:357 length:219 start_codon:yes stop_codon:yes gene_type:complete
MDKKYVVRRTEVVASYIVIDGAKNHDDAFNIFESMLESGQEIEFKDDEVLTSECEVLSDYESEQNLKNYLGE